MPLKVIVFSELAPRDPESGTSEGHGRRIEVDKTSFDAVMAELGPRLRFEIADRLHAGRGPLVVDLVLENVRAFTPDAVAAAIPATAELLKLRSALGDLMHGKGSLAGIRDLIGGMTTETDVAARILQALSTPPPQPAPPSAPAGQPSGSSSVDAILEMVDVPTEGTAPGRGADLMRLDALVRKLIGSGGKQDAPPSRILEGMIAEIDAAITDQVSEVLTQDEFLRLEAAWRGLKFLVERTDFREPIKLEIVVTPLESLVPIYDEVVHRPELDRLSSEPLGLMVIDFCFDRTPRDVEILKSLSERAASLSVPVITAAAPALFGVHEAPELAGMEGFSGAFAGSGNEKWTALRESGSSRWLGMAFNRFLLRPAHAAEGGAARAFRYTAPAEHQEAGGLWGNPCWAVASLATRSFARTGWCTDIMGQRSATAVEDLPVRALPRPGGKSVAYPLEVMVSDTLERELSSNGLMALTAAENSDRAYLRYAASVHAPKKYAEAVDTARARLQSTLPFQFFVGRVLNYAMLIEPMIVPGRAPEEIAASYRGALVGLLAGAGPVPEDAVSVSVLPGESDASRCDLCLKLRWPGFRSLPEAGEIELRWTIL